VIDGNRDPRLSRRLDDFLREIDGLRVEPFTEAQARIARQAYREFGKGSNSPAQLNYGDCFSYALAIGLDEPLLFKGNDFTHTDVRRAVWGGS
jgi:ribonuclease VapC